MDYTHRAKLANNYDDDAPASNGRYDENEIRGGVLRDVVRRQRAEIAALKAENTRLNVAIKELEREGLEPYRGFESFGAYASARELAESPHSDGQDGRMDNTTGAWAHLV